MIYRSRLFDFFHSFFDPLEYVRVRLSLVEKELKLQMYCNINTYSNIGYIRLEQEMWVRFYPPALCIIYLP